MSEAMRASATDLKAVLGEVEAGYTGSGLTEIEVQVALLDHLAALIDDEIWKLQKRLERKRARLPAGLAEVEEAAAVLLRALQGVGG